MDPKRVTRKLSAILSADVQGYSRLMGNDEVATVRTITEYREIFSLIVSQHNGRVIDSPGDNILSEFSSVVDAIQCAVEIQNALKAENEGLPADRRMVFRMGINLGDVIHEGDRIYGDGVNVAARLESLAEGGGICISGTAFDQVGKKIPLGYEYLGEQSVKNIEKPVRAYKILVEPEAVGKVIGEKRRLKVSHWTAIFGLVMLIIVVGTLTFWDFYVKPDVAPASVEKMAFPLPEKPSIAVLPFVNMSGEAKQEYIADGLTDNITNALSSLNPLFVITRNSSYTYKGKPVNAKQISEDLGVRYILEGSIQKSGNKLRVSARLIDALKGSYVWSKKYDRKMTDLFDVLDEITKATAIALQHELFDLNPDWGCTRNLEAWSYAVKAQDLMSHHKKEDNLRTRELAKQAMELDDEAPCPVLLVGWTHLFDARYGWSSSRTESMKLALEYANKALSLKHGDSSTYWLLGTIYADQGQLSKALPAYRKAVETSPNNALLLGSFARALQYAGYTDEAIAMYKQGMRIHPYYPAWFLWFLMRSYLHAELYDEAFATGKILLERCEKGELNPIIPHILLAEAYMHIGKQKEAIEQATEVLKINPRFTLEKWQKSQPYQNPADLERRLVALRKAGLPDKSPMSVTNNPSTSVVD